MFMILEAKGHILTLILYLPFGLGLSFSAQVSDGSAASEVS